jgi:phosphate transport system substrate-binding protein
MLGAAQAIENKGSDTLVNLALAWAEAYMRLYPDARISVTGAVRAPASPL